MSQFRLSLVIQRHKNVMTRLNKKCGNCSWNYHQWIIIKNIKFFTFITVWNLSQLEYLMRLFAFLNFFHFLPLTLTTIHLTLLSSYFNAECIRSRKAANLTFSLCCLKYGELSHTVNFDLLSYERNQKSCMHKCFGN